MYNIPVVVMKKKHLGILLPLLAILISLTAYAQEDVLRPEGKPGGYENIDYNFRRPAFTIGGEIGANFNLFSSQISWDPALDNSPMQAYTDGSGFSPYFSIMLDVPFSQKYGLQIKLAGDMKTFGNSYTGVADCRDDFTQELTDVNEKLKYSVTGSYLGFSVLFRMNLSPEFVLLAGPVYQMPMGNFEQEVTVSIVNSDCTFPDGTQVVNVTDDLADINSRIGLEIGAGYRIMLAPKTWMVPQIIFQYMLTKFEADEETTDLTREYSIGASDVVMADKMLQSLRFSLGFWFDM
jgi:hypothetical protein